jgi:PAS domain S-box-containing protein
MDEKSGEKQEQDMPSGSDFSSTMRIEIPPDLLDQGQQRIPETTRLRIRPQTPKTARLKAAEQADSKYSQLLQSIYDAAIITDIEGHIIDSNVRASEFLQFTHSEFNGQSILDIISGSDGSLLKTLCQNLQNEKFALLQAYCLRKDQTFFPAEIAVNALKFEQMFLCFFIRDVTLRKKAEEMLRTEHNAIQNAGNGIVIADVSARVEYANPAFLQMWGLERPEDIIGKDIRSLISDQTTAEMVGKVLEERESWNGEMQAKRADGQDFYAQVSMACNRDSDGEIVGMVFSFDDISDRKQAEEALRQSERQRVMLASVGAACHHLGQPATVIMTNLELIKRLTKDAGKPELEEIIQLTNEAAESLAGVLHKLNAVNEYRTIQYLDTKDSKSPTNIILDI